MRELSLTSKSQATSKEFNLTPEQSLFAQTEKRYVGYVSGVGAGKTFAGISRCLRNMLEWNPGEMGAIIAPTRTMVVDVIVNEMRNLNLFEKGFEYASAHTEEPGIHGPNGSRALILSADNKRTVERLKGLNLAWWWVDEEAEVPPRAREILMQRLRTGEYRNGFITTTPKGKNHTYEFFVGGKETDEYSYGSGHVYESDNSLAITGVPTWANPHTPDDYHEDMEDLPEEIRAQEVEGRFVEVSGGVYTADMFEWIDADRIADTVQPMIGVDPAVQADSKRAQDVDSDFWAVTLAYWYPNHSELYVADTAQKRGMTLQEGVSFIQSIVNEVESPQVVVESNQSQRWLQQELADKGVNAIPVQTTRNKEEKLIDMSIPISNGTVKFIDWREDETEELPYQ